MKESTLQCHVADYLRLQYPNVLFHSDFGSGLKLTPGQARIQYRQNGGRRAWPDVTPPQIGDVITLEDGTRLSVKAMQRFVGRDYVMEARTC